MTPFPKCDDCIHFTKGGTQNRWGEPTPHYCKRSGTTTLWERAGTLPGSAEYQRNCGATGQHKQTDAKAIPESLLRVMS